MTKKKKNPVNKSIKRNVILAKIRNCLEQANLCFESKSIASTEFAIRYLCQAEILIDLLEVDDCGSTGGFDVERGQNKDKMRTLGDRFEWLNKIS